MSDAQMQNRPESRRDWLLTDAPQTRRQARLGALYQGWLTFRSNKLAMFGLIILILLVPVSYTHLTLPTKRIV